MKLFTNVYGCTESMMGINLWMDDMPQRYLVVPNSILTEFIPEEKW